MRIYTYSAVIDWATSIRTLGRAMYKFKCQGFTKLSYFSDLLFSLCKRIKKLKECYTLPHNLKVTRPPLFYSDLERKVQSIYPHTR